MRRLVILAGSLALVAAAITGAVVTAASAADPVRLAGPTGPSGAMQRALQGVNFVSACGFSHRAPDDPIVFPNGPGLSHDHSFVGARSTNAFTTLESLLASTTTCHRGADTAGYWMPTLLDGTRAIEPVAAQIYYRRKTNASVAAFPPGLRVVAGDAKAASPQDRRITFWNCGPESTPSSTIPRCPAERTSMLRLHVTFPNCWDGSNLDSADHKSHMAYSLRGRCPSSHPVAVPAISLIYRYRTRGSSSMTLASGGQFSAHADFFNGWNQQELQSLVDGCLNALRHCQRGS